MEKHCLRSQKKTTLQRGPGLDRVILRVLGMPRTEGEDMAWATGMCVRALVTRSWEAEGGLGSWQGSTPQPRKARKFP
jgi:hypothetical protein